MASSNNDIVKNKLLEEILKETLVLGDNIVSIKQDVDTLKTTPYEILYYEQINITQATGSTTGTITFPSNSTLEEDNYPGNAVLAVLQAGGEVSNESPRDSSGNIVTASLDSAGNWISTGFSNSSVGIVFTLLVQGIDIINLDSTKVINVVDKDNQTASEVPYDNSISGLLASNVQDTIDEITAVTKVAGEDINAARVIRLENNEAFYYSTNTISNYGKAIGLSQVGVVTGNNVRIITEGLLTTTFTLVPNSVYFASTNGVITNIPPTTGLCTEIGYAISTNQLFINIKDTVELI